VTLYKGEGCEKCGGTGYKGRQGLYEVMPMSAEIRKLIMQGASADELRDAAISEGMLTLRMDGLRKLEKGMTTLEEVMKETASGT
jgi:type II secretory ATPase GspE/PulE/Tfp pilus assembly ATPase PilB-like protein